MRIFLLVLLLCAAAVMAVWRGWVDVPPQWNPWAPLDVQLEPNLLTPFKLARLQDDPALCDLALESSSLRYSRQADSDPSARCPLQNTLRIQGGDIALSSSFLASCPLAVAYALFDIHTLQPAAQAVFGQRVARIDHLGSFACRNIYNRANSRLSQHATANALDIAGFRLADGQRINLLKDWSDEGDKGRFLRLVRDGACKNFSTVLGPEYNAAHRDHFHLDMGLWQVCR
ncbi:extensin family protein [Pseudomonas cichorii]|uniref:Extensin family protein n=1 Tax=Pseudomonas lijiangensis TaxID=2995658 RepID=A0ABX8HWE6_9PSED|nr:MULTISPECIES: extensin family protein [Pseudomonas syringae group]MBX8490448.1 extensin family protein [Pseudomonas cichorii]MBX8498945.1 extensin family protein [Pseudomonas lijiangensis]MBX8504186.1 extensin family protein [Pseudomonas lijiangensis]MBX8508661.1 extensin family protein [Pseudomonas cichorii]MBX8523679.1 extensin family protein [Pseudomonas cichorii]